MLIDYIAPLLRAPKGSVLVVGDIILDEYATFNETYSENENTWTYQMTNSRFFPGGAANVASNLLSLGSKVYLYGGVGHDDAARRLDHIFAGQLQSEWMICSDVPTATKIRISHTNTQRTLKLERSRSNNFNIQFRRRLLENIREVIDRVDAIIVSDYGLGIVDEKLVSSLHEWVDDSKTPIIVDPRGSDFSKYMGASLLTPNMREFCILTKKKSNNWREAVVPAKSLLKEMKLLYMVLKDGERGSVLIGDQEKIYCPAFAKKAVCTVGAGDTFLAAMSFGLSEGAGYAKSFVFGNLAAACAISKKYTATVSLGDIMKLARQHNLSQHSVYIGE